MEKSEKIIVTGAKGFIGQNVVEYLRNVGFSNLILIDKEEKEELLNTFAELLPAVVIHLGASVDTGDIDRIAVMENNFEYSKKLFNLCVQHDVRFIYASSAATYGDGAKGFDDRCRDLIPQNNYAESKHLFDLYVLDVLNKPPQWVGLKFFNVYGPHESHKGRMASTVLFSYHQAKENGVIRLFRSHSPEYNDGEQMRDFVYVFDVAKVIHFFLTHKRHSGIFNLGTGRARTFLDLAHAVFAALGKEPTIEFVDTPKQFRKQYQYFTQANIQRLREVGYAENFTALEDGVRDYIQNYLEK